MPKDLTRVKAKVAFNLTKRQMICFGTGGLLGIPLFFLLRGPMGPSPAAMCMVLVMLPFFLVGVYEKNGQLMVTGYRIMQKERAGRKSLELSAFRPVLLFWLLVDEAMLDAVSERDGEDFAVFYTKV